MKVSAGTRACLAVSASVLSFALLIESAGLLPAIVATVIVATQADTTRRWRESLLLAVAIAAAVALLFVGLLGQPVALVAGF
jgi:hypothetical protein